MTLWFLDFDKLELEKIKDLESGNWEIERKFEKLILKKEIDLKEKIIEINLTE